LQTEANLDAFAQQDPQEILNFVLDMMQEQSPTVASLITGMVCQLSWTSCGADSPTRNDSPFIMLHLIVPYHRQEECVDMHRLIQRFTREERIYGEMQGRKRAYQTIKKSISTLPPILTISLDRVRSRGGIPKKAQTTVQFPTTLRSSEYQGIEPGKTYDLRGLIAHKGMATSGHYIYMHWTGEGDNWIVFNDAKIYRADGESDEIVSLRVNPPDEMPWTPYLLMYHEVHVPP